MPGKFNFKISFSTNDVGTTGQPYAIFKKTLVLTLYYIQKLTINVSYYKCKKENFKYLGKDLVENCDDLGFHK